MISFSESDVCLVYAGADTTRVGMIVFSRTPELVFDLDEYDSYSDLKNVELVPRPKLIAGTYTGKALDMMVDVFASSGRKVGITTLY